MRFRHKRLIVILLASFWLCFSPQAIDYLALPASAAIEQQAVIPESLKVINNFEDETGNVWELIVWSEASDENSDVYLRLVGYPLFELDHDRPLQFLDRDRVLFEAKDLYDRSLAFHVAKYNVKDILPQLSAIETLNLSFYLTGDRHVNLKIPPEAIAQWREFTKTKKRDTTHQLQNRLKITFLLA